MGGVAPTRYSLRDGLSLATRPNLARGSPKTGRLPRVCLSREVERRLFLDRCGLALVAGQERDGTGGEHEDGSDQQGELVALARGVGDRRLAGLQDRRGPLRRERGEDGQADCATELRPGVEQARGEAGLVGADPRVGGGGGADEHAAEA